MQQWKVIFQGRIISRVFYDKDCDAWYVRHTLINHDGFPGNIEVARTHD